MSAATVKLIALLAYGAFVLISKAVKASRQSRIPGGMPFPQEAPRQPHPMAGPAAVRRVAKPRVLPRRPPARVAPALKRRVPPPPVRRPAPKPKEEGPRHTLSLPAQSRLQAEGTARDLAQAKADPPPVSSSAHPLLGGRLDLRRAFLMSEVLGPPLALR